MTCPDESFTANSTKGKTKGDPYMTWHEEIKTRTSTGWLVPSNFNGDEASWIEFVDQPSPMTRTAAMSKKGTLAILRDEMKTPKSA